MGNTSSEFGKTSVYLSDSNKINSNKTEETQEEIQEESIRPGYYKNKKGVYYEGVSLKLSKKELNTFKKLKYSYAKTVTFVYYKGEIIHSANPKTFVLFNRKNMPEEFKNLNSVIGMDYENNLKRIYQFGKLIYTFKI